MVNRLQMVRRLCHYIIYTKLALEILPWIPIIFWRGLDCWWPLRFNWFLCSSAHTSSETSSCKHFWRRLDQRQWKEVVAQLNGRKPEPDLGTGFGYCALVHHTAARRRSPCMSGVVVFGSAPWELSKKVLMCHQKPLDWNEVGCIK